MKTHLAKFAFTLLSTLLISFQTMAQLHIKTDPFAHTYSIVARDSITGDMAVGVQSHWFSVGSLVAWGKSGVGVVATQSFVNPAYGPEGLALMEDGKTAKEALEELLAKDEGRAYRQVAFLDANGTTAAHTGESCIDYANHQNKSNYSVQANMMLTNKVVPAMEAAFRKHSDLPLAERIVKVLQAAEAAGGDIRGKQSAALLVVGAEPVMNSWQDKKIDLRVDDHENPLQELERLLKVHRAYEHMNRGDIAVEEKDMDKALKEYGAAEALFPDNLEMQFWKAVALANNQQMKKALPLFKKIFQADDNWRELVRRLPKAGLLAVSESELQAILSQ